MAHIFEMNVECSTFPGGHFSALSFRAAIRYFFAAAHE
jgi:hypothetical protein